jgi:hypothetical protein
MGRPDQSPKGTSNDYREAHQKFKILEYPFFWTFFRFGFGSTPYKSLKGKDLILRPLAWKLHL